MALLDSNVLIYANTPEGRFLNNWIDAADSCVSGITIPEVLGYPKLDNEDRLLFEGWFHRLRVLHVSEAILWKSAEIRRAKRMSVGDAIIAATALHYGLELVTRNVADFAHLPELRIVNPFA